MLRTLYHLGPRNWYWSEFSFQDPGGLTVYHAPVHEMPLEYSGVLEGSPQKILQTNGKCFNFIVSPANTIRTSSTWILHTHRSSHQLSRILSLAPLKQHMLPQKCPIITSSSNRFWKIRFIYKPPSWRFLNHPSQNKKNIHSSTCIISLHFLGSFPSIFAANPPGPKNGSQHETPQPLYLQSSHFGAPNGRPPWGSSWPLNDSAIKDG